MIANLFRAALFHGLLAAVGGVGAAANAQTLALVGGKLYASPEATALDDAVVVAADGVVTAIGKRSDVQVPPDAHVIDCNGKTIVAGFWNSHVHFTEAVWRNAQSAPAAPLTAHMQAMLTRWGFTTVWDLGSDGRDTMALRRRINAGEVSGPTILTAGSIFPKDGHPAYLPADMNLPMASNPDEAARWARTFNDFGFDGLKLFTGSFMGSGKPVINMSPDIAKAAVEVAHAAGKPVFAHPQNMAGVDAVIAAGVDVMAHTVAGEPVYSPDQLAHFKQQGIALVPTLALFSKLPVGPDIAARLVATTVNQLKTFSENGGTVLFGTDVGFTNQYDTTLEYELMHRALSERQVLASLTTNPARYFKAAKKGRIESGLDADLVVLDGDPIADISNLARVAWTIRAGKVIYQKP
jgi:imidazolonepropionase-like amidohydrolase